MTPEEIIAMAKEAGIHIDRLPDEYCTAVNLPLGSVSRWDGVGLGELQSFAALVAAKEREACADLCDRFAARTTEAQQGPSDALSNVMLRQVAVLGFGEAAHAIRARGTKEGA